MAFIDFTNPAACKWYQSKLAALVAMGVDSFKVCFLSKLRLLYHLTSYRLISERESQLAMLFTLMDLIQRRCIITTHTCIIRLLSKCSKKLWVRTMRLSSQGLLQPVCSSSQCIGEVRCSEALILHQSTNSHPFR